jgi:hypothetical protein
MNIETMTAGQLIELAQHMASRISHLPTTDVVDSTKWPNKAQQESLLARAAEAALHVAWALEDYSSKGNQDVV